MLRLTLCDGVAITGNAASATAVIPDNGVTAVGEVMRSTGNSKRVPIMICPGGVDYQNKLR